MKQEKICPVCRRSFVSKRKNRVCFNRSCQRFVYQSPRAGATDNKSYVPPNKKHTLSTMYNGYGENWPAQAELCRERDSYTCQRCQTAPIRSNMVVHHIVPIKEFKGDYETANRLDNLVVLCKKCHQQAHRELRESAQ